VWLRRAEVYNSRSTTTRAQQQEASNNRLRKAEWLEVEVGNVTLAKETARVR